MRTNFIKFNEIKLITQKIRQTWQQIIKIYFLKHLERLFLGVHMLK